MSRRTAHPYKGSDINGASNTVNLQVRIFSGRGLSRQSAQAHFKRKNEFYAARDEYRALTKELSEARIKAYAEAAVAGMGLDQDKPL